MTRTLLSARLWLGNARNTEWNNHSNYNSSPLWGYCSFGREDGGKNEYSQTKRVQLVNQQKPSKHNVV